MRSRFIKVTGREAEKPDRLLEHLLLLRRTLFSVFILGSLQLPVTPGPGDPTFGLYRYTHALNSRIIGWTYQFAVGHMGYRAQRI